jgi:hypothetical protein
MKVLMHALAASIVMYCPQNTVEFNCQTIFNLLINLQYNGKHPRSRVQNAN